MYLSLWSMAARTLSTQLRGLSKLLRTCCVVLLGCGRGEVHREIVEV